MVRSIIVMTTRAEWRGEIFVVFIVVRGALLRHNTTDMVFHDEKEVQQIADTRRRDNTRRTTASHVGLKFSCVK